VRDLPGLAAKIDKVVEQLRGYAARLPQAKKGNPYTHADGKRKRLKTE